jgi:predicted site-specific integrase-resolvase
MVVYNVHVNLKEWAEREGVAYVTARRWFAAGKLPVPAWKVGGLILVGEHAGAAPTGITAVYARVSSADQKPDLDRQVARVTAWAAAEGLAVGVVTEVGPALNGERREFLALLRGETVNTIVTEHRTGSPGSARST